MRNIAIAALILVATPVFAQNESPETGDDTFTIGVGAASVPRYEGADDNTISPAGAVRGSFDGISFSTIGTALYTDLIPGPDGPGLDFILGPVAHLTLNRTSRKRTRDPQIAALGKLDVAVEVGADIGVRRTGVITSEYDTVSFDVAVMRDVTNTHDSWIVVPTFAYATPLSRTVYAGASVSATHVGSGYGRTYLGVDATQSVASGLPVYNPGKGFKDISFGLLGNLSLSGDLRKGFSVFAIGSYSKLLGDFKRSPVVRNGNQWFGGLGLAYTF